MRVCVSVGGLQKSHLSGGRLPALIHPPSWKHDVLVRTPNAIDEDAFRALYHISISLFTCCKSHALTWTIWHVLVPATAARRCLDSSTVGTTSERAPSTVYLAATVPSQPAYLHRVSETSTETLVCATYASMTPLPTGVPSDRPISSAAFFERPLPMGMPAVRTSSCPSCTNPFSTNSLRPIF